uniref:Cadherin n=1 Tax=Mesocestoides corti TaxID=53468 RepID=A0A5K3F956_MESCO
GAVDEDSGVNGIQTYSFHEVDFDNATFGVKFQPPYELNLIVQKKLDYEKKSAYKGLLRACDGGRPTPRCASQEVSIFISDVNDNKPEFKKDLYEVRISEATPVKSVIIAVTATDADSGKFGKLNYRFGQTYDQNVGKFFGINENTGEVWVRSPLDAKVVSHLKVPVIARDGGPIPKTGTTLLQIDIEDVNNHSPWIEVKSITSPSHVEKPLDSFVQLWVEENQPVGTQIGIILTGDKDVGSNGEVSCLLRGNTSLFQLRHSNSGRERKMYSLQSNSRFDLESMHPHSKLALQIECTDAGRPRLVSRQNIHVNVMDVNEYPAYFTQDQSNFLVHIPEDAKPGSLVVQVQATDRDATPQMQYELVGEANDLFRVDSDSGRVYSLHKFDREQVGRISFGVRVVEKDFLDSRVLPAGPTVANVTLLIDDVNDNSPVLEGSRVFQVFENRPAYSDLIGQLTASDADAGENGTLRFWLSSINSYQTNATFDVNPVSGKIYAKEVLDRETTAQYQLEIEISDLGRPFPRQTLERIFIDVMDENDNKPVWKPPLSLHEGIAIEDLSSITMMGSEYADRAGMPCVAFVNISHQASGQDHIIKLVATDADSEPNANLSFGVIGVNYYHDNAFDFSDPDVLHLAEKPQPLDVSSHFRVSFATWVLSAVRPPQSGLYELTVRASDNGNPPLNSNALMYLRFERGGTSVAGLFGITHRGRFAILILVVCLLTCSILLLLIVCLVRSRLKRRNSGEGGIIATVNGEKVREANHLYGPCSNIERWQGKQVFPPQTPFMGSLELSGEMSTSLVRSTTDCDTSNCVQMSHTQCRTCPSATSLPMHSTVAAVDGSHSDRELQDADSLDNPKGYYPRNWVTVSAFDTQSDGCARVTTFHSTKPTSVQQLPYPYANYLGDTLPRKDLQFESSLHNRWVAPGDGFDAPAISCATVPSPRELDTAKHVLSFHLR